MPKVAILPDHIASQIAAGEVVERPSSVIKELVENSIDAGASQIEISVSQDMRDLRVADNGSGMEPEDAVLAFQRHATSKITSADDLSSLSTLGFRGEALPSIASISKFTCYTRPKAAATGTKVEIKDGTVSATETGCAQGTVMEIFDLFYNVPARLKFLKKASTEFGHAQEIVQSLAVAHPEIMFELRRGDALAFKTGGTGDTALAAEESKLFSGVESLCEVSGRDERFGLSVKGLVARPNHFRGDRKGILSMVNQRPVRCPLTYKALEYAYSDLIPRGRHPFAVINIEIAPEHIDVNIHPTKKEIKYTDSNAVYMALHRAIGDALRQPRRELFQANAAPAIAGLYGGDEATNLDDTHSSQTRESERFRQSERSAATVLQSINMYRRDDDQSDPATTSGDISGTEKVYDFAPNSDRVSLFSEEAPAYTSSHVEQLSFSDSLNYVPKTNSNDSEILNLATDEDLTLPQGWRLAGYIHNTYFMFETPLGLEVIEQHIAHERLLYERILAAQSTRGRISDNVQRLCISAPLQLTAQQLETLKASTGVLEQLGFEFESSEGGTVTCSQVPLELAHQNYATVIHKMIEDLETADAANLELEATKSIACQSAIKNGMPLSSRDIIKLVSAWLNTPRNDTCPHGRPVRLKFSMDKLFEMFHPA
ncbi:MAG: DNA mismatch repair endonuclease MutL [Candidatus Obscuribacterales bacterium]|nr:DNA mismatch repair endonuclease MutL [Candidatus Obscuribacterales bacterium]